MARARPNGASENQASSGAVAQTAVVMVATAGKTRPHPVPTRSLMRFSTAPRIVPAARVLTSQMAARPTPMVPSRPRAQLKIIR